jgi:hypothetical protein
MSRTVYVDIPDNKKCLDICVKSASVSKVEHSASVQVWLFMPNCLLPIAVLSMYAATRFADCCSDAARIFDCRMLPIRDLRFAHKR